MWYMKPPKLSMPTNLELHDNAQHQLSQYSRSVKDKLLWSLPRREGFLQAELQRTQADAQEKGRINQALMLEGQAVTAEKERLEIAVKQAATVPATGQPNSWS